MALLLLTLKAKLMSSRVRNLSIPFPFPTRKFKKSTTWSKVRRLCCCLHLIRKFRIIKNLQRNRLSNSLSIFWSTARRSITLISNHCQPLTTAMRVSLMKKNPINLSYWRVEKRDTTRASTQSSPSMVPITRIPSSSTMGLSSKRNNWHRSTKTKAPIRTLSTNPLIETLPWISHWAM